MGVAGQHERWLQLLLPHDLLHVSTLVVANVPVFMETNIPTDHRLFGTLQIGYAVNGVPVYFWRLSQRSSTEATEHREHDFHTPIMRNYSHEEVNMAQAHVFAAPYEHHVCSLGDTWEKSSLLWGVPAGCGSALEQRSPVDASLIQRTYLLDQHELEHMLGERPCTRIDQSEVWPFAARLHAALAALSPLLLETMQFETGFTKQDCEEMLEGSLAYVSDFKCSLHTAQAGDPNPLPYAVGVQQRQIQLARVPWGTVAVILPQNAFLLIALTTMLNALATGNSVILRAPQQSARSAALLAVALRAADVPGNMVSVVLAKARDFIDAVYRTSHPTLLHYMGSSQHAPQIVTNALHNGKPVIVDGSGNSWVWVDADVPVETVAQILTTGALRYNGQTCTSINGAMIHPAIYPAVQQCLVERWNQLVVGNPITSVVDVGPLFDEEQAAWCEQQLLNSGGYVLCGGHRNGNFLTPTMVADPAADSPLVREGLFGGGLWITAGDRDAFIGLWRNNRYPLCAGVLSPTAEPGWWAARLPSVARVVMNGDPSIEYIFEPWGGYPSSGMNGVGIWYEKYQRVVSIDAPIPSC